MSEQLWSPQHDSLYQLFLHDREAVPAWIRLLSSTQNAFVEQTESLAVMPLGSLDVSGVNYSAAVEVRHNQIGVLSESVHLRLQRDQLTGYVHYRFTRFPEVDDFTVSAHGDVDRTIAMLRHADPMGFDMLDMEFAERVFPGMASALGLPVEHLIATGYMWLDDPERLKPIEARGYVPRDAQGNQLHRRVWR
ncbi:MAG: hypothetical protein TR69_WS6001000038 [candidate division WS6 bacterium OLB20]|uniref:Uncharacterized protein n=1 Tax=candidate division WS6 bacterium OLB20 TaxID=1617426 RepID=A0A136M119_9BACT|nr:MAG: hypothetical protein TR69_WS6001000038 [candidate division WS6 bacterium OLB20]